MALGCLTKIDQNYKELLGGASLLVNEKSPLCRFSKRFISLYYTNINFFENLGTTVMNISNTKRHKSILLIGYFIARTGNLEDILENNTEDNSE